MRGMRGVRSSFAGAFFGVGLTALALAPPSVVGCSSDPFVATDASTTDAPSSDGSDGGATFCSTHPRTSGPTTTFCDDFETNTGTGFDPIWKLDVTSGSSVVREANPSGGFDFLSSTPAVGPIKRKAELFYDPNLTTVTHIAMSMKVKIGASCGEGTNLIALAGFTPNSIVGLAVGIGPGADREVIGLTALSLMGDAGKSDTTVGSGDVVFDSWTDLSFEMTFGRPRADGGGGTNGVDIKVVFGGQPRIDIVGGEGANAILAPQLYVGAVTEGANGTCVVRYDDVLFELTK